MISVEEAQQKILASVGVRPPVSCRLEDAAGRFLAESIASPCPLPLFDNSAMDGYAVSGEGTRFSVRGTLQAGDSSDRKLQSGEAMRIFTGAAIPPGTYAVIKQEEVDRKDGSIVLERSPKKGENIRGQGEEIKKGDLLLRAGERLTPAAVGFLASVGLSEIPVASEPRVGVLVTGSEIVDPSAALKPGQIFDSNSFALKAALRETGLAPIWTARCPDQKEPLREKISEALHRTDFLIVTGGVSVGDFDFVKDVAASLGVEEIFWKVRQKPGKPIYFGRREEKYLFGLPGNPASALVCFYEYVRPALLRAMGSREPFLPAVKARLRRGTFTKKPGMTHFLKGRLSEESSVEILENQGSHMMSSFAQADCLVVVPEERDMLRNGDEVDVHLLPQ